MVKSPINDLKILQIHPKFVSTRFLRVYLTFRHLPQTIIKCPGSARRRALFWPNMVYPAIQINLYVCIYYAVAVGDAWYFIFRRRSGRFRTGRIFVVCLFLPFWFCDVDVLQVGWNNLFPSASKLNSFKHPSIVFCVCSCVLCVLCVFVCVEGNVEKYRSRREEGDRSTNVLLAWLQIPEGDASTHRQNL